MTNIDIFSEEWNQQAINEEMKLGGMTMDQQAKKNLQRRRLKGYTCRAVGCGASVLVFALMIYTFVWYAMYYHKFGENQARAPKFSPAKGTNFSYDVTYSNSLIEFTIAEIDFLDWCKKNDWSPVEIKDVPSLPKVVFDRDNDAAWPRINEEQGGEIPLAIPRYKYKKPEHERCRYGEECQIDPTGKTDEACFRLVDDGYYHERRARSMGGFYILYDRENNRCYVQTNPR